LAFVLLPLQRLAARLARREEDADLRAQRLIQRASHSFVRLSQALGAIRVCWHGAERLERRPILVVANHPSLIDTPLLTSRMPQADFVVSPEWSRNPYLRRAAAAAGYLRADRGADVVDDAVARLRAGRSVVIFPEGSRTPREGLRRFQRGAAHIALRAGCDLVPVLIQVTPRTLMKGQRWSDLPDRTPEWRIEVGEPIRPAEHLDGSESRPLAARRLTAVLRDHFEKRWDRGEL
jgi:1-acyl-sn-glycerol-3-phosphate acyltransferase